MCFLCIGPLSIALSPVCQLQQSRCSAHNQIPPRVLTMEDANEVRIARTYTMEDAYEVKITRTLHSFHNVNKTRCDVKFVKFHEEMNI